MVIGLVAGRYAAGKRGGSGLAANAPFKIFNLFVQPLEAGSFLLA